jgi:transketolase
VSRAIFAQPYTSTFLMFVEYARNAVRMAALMKQRQVMVYTHDPCSAIPLAIAVIPNSRTP